MKKTRCGHCGAKEQNGKLIHFPGCPENRPPRAAPEISDWDKERLKRWHKQVVRDAEKAVHDQSNMTISGWWREREWRRE